MNTKRKPNPFKSTSFGWFVVESYHYISPKSFKEWFRFVIEFPGSWIRFNRTMKEYLRADT